MKNKIEKGSKLLVEISLPLDELWLGNVPTLFKQSKGESFPNTIVRSYTGEEAQFLSISGNIEIVNRGNLHFWGCDTGELYTLTHDATLYVAGSKKEIKKMVRRDCGKSCSRKVK